MDHASLPCPCCGFPTLSERGGYEICAICWWEDDGQDDESADEVWGGPNGKYSLSKARKNFEDHGHKYDIGQGIEIVENVRPGRLNLLRYVFAVRNGVELDQAELDRLIEQEQLEL
ncbi:MAG: CPCC family cysteine-rich protein [Pseudomonadota bacterium]